LAADCPATTKAYVTPSSQRVHWLMSTMGHTRTYSISTVSGLLSCEDLQGASLFLWLLLFFADLRRLACDYYNAKKFRTHPSGLSGNRRL
jgi:hypothetical protein